MKTHRNSKIGKFVLHVTSNQQRIVISSELCTDERQPRCFESPYDLIEDIENNK